MRKPARYSDAFLPSSGHPTSVRASARPWFDHPSGLPSRDFAPLNIGCPPPRCPHNDLVAKLRDGERRTRGEPVVPLCRPLLLRPSSVPSGMSYKSPCTLFTRREAAERCRGGRGERDSAGEMRGVILKIVSTDTAAATAFEHGAACLSWTFGHRRCPRSLCNDVRLLSDT